MNLNTMGKLSALGALCAVAAGCASTAPSSPPIQAETTQAFITGTALFRERLALPNNAVFEATLEDVSRADAPATVLGQQNISPAGNPPYVLNIPYNPAKLQAGARYNVRTTIRVNNALWFTSDQATPVFQQAGDSNVNITMRRVAQSDAQPGSPTGSSPALVPIALQHNWQVTKLGATTLKADAKAPQLRFDGQEAKVSGNTSCNNFSAAYTLQNKQLQFSQVMMTKMMCQNSHEKAFLQALNSVRTQHLVGDTLQLRNANGTAVITAKRL